MIKTLIQLVKTGNVTQKGLFPDLPAYSRGLPMLTDTPCQSGCKACGDACPTNAIQVEVTPNGAVTIDLGLCIACGACTDSCPAGTIAENRKTTVAVRRREKLVLSNKVLQTASIEEVASAKRPFRRSLHIREVSTGDNASDLEVAAANNPIFDSSRFGIHFVASPRFADALLVTGPVGRAMQEPLRRCYEAMAEPRLVIAVGASAISGGLHRQGYASANGVDPSLPVDVYVPGNPPHPWYILHGLLLAMGHPRLSSS